MQLKYNRAKNKFACGLKLPGLLSFLFLMGANFHSLLAQPLITASPDVTICAPATTTLTASITTPTLSTTSYLISTIPYNPDPFTVGTQVFLGDDQFSGVLNIGFDFCFYGNSYNQLLISSNNYVSFDLTNANGFSPWSIPGPVPSPANPMNTVLGPWQDINPGVGGQIFYNVAGTAPFRRFVVSYFNVPMFSCTGLLYSSQIILYETTNVIETHILNKPLCTTWNNGQAIHALHDITGTIADVVTGRNAPTQWNAANEGIRFTPNGAPAYTVNWLVNNTVVATGTSYTVSPTSTTTYVAQLLYNCTNASFTDTVVVTAASNQPTPIAGAILVCPNDTASYTVPFSSTATYTWTVSGGFINSGQGTHQILVTWTGPAPASVQVLIQDNGCSSNGNLAVTLGQVVSVTSSGLGPLYCQVNQNIALTGSPGGGVFSGPGVSGSNFNPFTAGAGTHAVIYTISTPGNCSRPDTQMVSVVSPIGNNTISASQTLCFPNIPALLTGTAPTGGSGSYTYQWQSNTGSGWISIPGGTNTNQLPSGSTTASYRRIVGGSSACGPVTSQTVTITVDYPVGNNSIGNSQTLCSLQAPQGLTGTLPSGGTGSFVYLWESSPNNIIWAAAQGPNNSQNYSPVAPVSNTYYRRVISSGSCAPSTSVVIHFEISTNTTLSLIGDTICEGQFATISAQGTPAGGTYTWLLNPIQTGQTIQVNPQVTTNYTLQYALSGCTVTDSVKVVVYPSPAPQIQINGNLSFCQGDSVVLNALPSGGNYLWSNGAITQSIRIINSGTWSVQITDMNGCPAASTPVVTTAIPAPQAQLNLNSPACFGDCNGSISAIVSSGMPPYTLTWNTTPVQLGIQATGLCADTGSVIITDAIGCSSSSTWSLNQPSALNFTPIIQQVSCFGMADGSIQVSGSGGTAPYLFGINNLPLNSGNVFNGLSAQNYLITIQDARNCQFQLNVVMPQPSLLQAGITGTNPLCFGQGNGQATVLPIGGTPPYTYVWNNGGTTAGIANLFAGIYSVVVRDSFNCMVQATTSITEPALLTASASGFDLTCSTPPDNGIGTVNVQGGTPPYSYLWSVGNNPTSGYNTGMPAGTWVVQVQDNQGCLTSAGIVLNAPVYPQAFVFPDTSMCTGSGGVPIQGWGLGGIPPYTYQWTPNNGSLNNTNAAQTFANPDTTTTYFFQVIDDAGCASPLVPQKVTVNPLPIVDAGPDLTFCENGPAVFLTGSVSPAGNYSVQWTPGNLVYCDTCLTTYTVPTTSSIYTLRATNRLTGCSSDSTTLNTLSSVVVSVRPRPVADAGPDTLICYGGSAQLCGTAGNAGPAYSWYWQPAMHINDTASQCPVVNPPSTFTWFLVTESDGCTSIADSVTVIVSPLPVVDAGVIQNVCEGDSVQLQGQVQNGLAQAFRWFPAIGLSDSSVLKPMVSPSLSGWYYLQAAHQGCPGNIDSVQVLVHSRPIADAGRDTLICGDNLPVRLLGTYQYNGNQPVFVTWQPGNMQLLQPMVSTTTSQIYVMEVRSGVAPTACTSRDSVLISVLPDVAVTVTADTNSICPGLPVRLQAQAGVGGALFNWSPDPGQNQQGISKPIVYPDSSLVYRVVASEAGCSDTAYYKVNVHPKVEAYFNPSQIWGCAPFELQFQNLSANALSYTWNFGDNSPISNETEPAHVFEKSGVYYLRLIATGVGECKDTFDFAEPVRMGDSLNIQAYLEPSGPVELTLPMAQVKVYATPVDESIDLLWKMGDGKSKRGIEVFYQYVDTGTYYITLEAKHNAGCSVEKQLGPIVVKAPEIFIPNVFTPNGDGNFDEFRINYTGDEAFYLVIYDRWGVTCFETYNKNQGWNGKDLNGMELREGVYFYSVRIGKYNDMGNITLLR